MPLRQELARHLHNCKMFQSSLPAHSSTTFLVSVVLFENNNLESTSCSSRSEMAGEVGNMLLQYFSQLKKWVLKGQR